MLGKGLLCYMLWLRKASLTWEHSSQHSWKEGVSYALYESISEMPLQEQCGGPVPEAQSTQRRKYEMRSKQTNWRVWGREKRRGGPGFKSVTAAGALRTDNVKQKRKLTFGIMEVREMMGLGPVSSSDSGESWLNSKAFGRKNPQDSVMD